MKKIGLHFWNSKFWQMCVNKIERYFVNENFVYCYDIHNSAYTVKIEACYFLNILKKLLCLCENMYYILKIFLENLNRLHTGNSVFSLTLPTIIWHFAFKKKFTIAVDTPFFTQESEFFKGALSNRHSSQKVEVATRRSGTCKGLENK